MAGYNAPGAFLVFSKSSQTTQSSPPVAKHYYDLGFDLLNLTCHISKPIIYCSPFRTLLGQHF